MRILDLRKLKSEKLLNIKKDLKFELVKARTPMAVDSKDKYSNSSLTKKGKKTSLTKNLKKHIAKINTILRERGLDEK